MTDGGRSISTHHGGAPLLWAAPTGALGPHGSFLPASADLVEMLMSHLTPPARHIDPRGQRFGAGLSAVILAAAFLLDLPWLAVLVGVDLALSSAFGTRLFLPSRPWPFLRRVLRLGPVELEHEYPPRFAQALGATVLAFATIGFVIGAPLVGWLLTGAVAALQTLLAVTGICLGCRLYFLRWWVPSRFAILARRADARRRTVVPRLVRVD